MLKETKLKHSKHKEYLEEITLNIKNIKYKKR